jgi:hydroxypyruvate isomerase
LFVDKRHNQLKKYTIRESIMPRFSANLSMLFNEVEFLDRFERAAQAGFKAVEYMFPYEWPKEQLAEKLATHNLKQVLFNLPAGDWADGERGIACIPGREGEFKDGVASAIDYAEALQCPTVNCLAGLTPEGIDLGQVRQTLVNNLQFAADALDKKGIRFVIEMLSHKAVPGFLLVQTQEALRLMEAVNHPNIKIQYDVYHMQIMEGNLIDTLTTQMTPTCSPPLIRRATTDGSDVNIYPPEPPKKALGGSRRTRRQLYKEHVDLIGKCDLIKFGVLEYWSNGVMAEDTDIFLQYSNTPSLQYSTLI